MAVLYLVMTILFAWGVIGSSILLIISLTSKKLKIDAKIPCICLIITMGMSIGSMVSYSDEVLKNRQVATITNHQKETIEERTTEVATEPKVYEYDTLQKLFMQIDMDITTEELEQLISDNSLKYTYEEHGIDGNIMPVTYQIAYTEDSAKQRYGKWDDHISISFDKGNNNKFMHAEYIDQDIYTYSALTYNYGTWWDFRFLEGNSYSGYYNKDSFSDNTGISVKYTNGDIKRTNCFKCNSAEEAIQKIIYKLAKENESE